MIAIPNMERPESCQECPIFLWCYTANDWKGYEHCTLIELDENDPMLLEFLNEFDKWRAYKEVMNYIKSVYKEGEANDIR